MDLISYAFGNMTILENMYTEKHYWRLQKHYQVQYANEVTRALSATVMI